MSERRDRGVLATEEGVERLRQALASKRNCEARSWRKLDLAIESGVDERTVRRFLNREQPVDENTARAICQALGVEFREIIEFNSPYPLTDKTGQPQSNPFVYGTPVPPNRFYGRKRVIADVKNRIGALSGQSINIVGFRRSGKSSLLRYIKERPEEFCLTGQNPLIVSLDLQNHRYHSPEGIIEGLRHEIAKLTGTVPWSNTDNTNPYEVDNGLTALRKKGYRLIVMLDELERIGQRLEQFQDWGEDWRAKASDDLFALVIASKRSLSEVYNQFNLTSPFSNIFSKTVLGVLEKDAWQQLVCDGFAPKKVPPENLDWLDDLTGGFPHYVQMAASLLWQYENPEQAKTEFIFQATDRFQELWQNLEEPERQALRFAAEMAGFMKPTAAMSDRLQRYGLLRSDGKLFSTAFADFVRRQ
ncbi:MAG: helix-turn-helix domain-containing protein [Nostoc sp.]|uniref:helix-turn-helix domain-containing protein n=1 Tax=Nostoc sp. TaxID=1180 RepID=UPI002FFAAFCC